MRVTNRSMYDTFLNNMQSTLGAYMESNIQGGSQKKINKPSDDPAGMALVLNTRRNIDNTEQFQRNVDTAKGWLGLADSTLMQTSSTIKEIKTLAEQAATESVTAENRQQIAFQIRQLFGQLLNLSNTQFENKSIFAGHKYDESAFDEVLTVTSKDDGFPAEKCTVTGKSDKTMAIRFNEDGFVGGGVDLTYKWSNDGGKTWQDGTLPAGENKITVDGVSVTIPMNSPVKGPLKAGDMSSKDGTMLFIRPTANYKGDVDNSNSYAAQNSTVPSGVSININGNIPKTMDFVLIDPINLSGATAGAPFRYSLDGGATIIMGNLPNPATGKLEIPIPAGPGGGTGATLEVDATKLNPPLVPAGAGAELQPRRTDIMGGASGLKANTQGTFNSNTLVRIDNDAQLDVGGNTVRYSYSTDGGTTWVNATSQTPNPPTDMVRLNLPGGYTEISATGADKRLTMGTQMIVHPDRADLDFEIMQDSYVSVNNVGKDIFGGVYNGRTVEQPNLFETVGELIAFCEYNDTDGISAALANITKAHEKVETANTHIGGLENRLTLAADVHTFSKLDQQQRLSYTEDIDLTTLLSNLAKQELAYNTVLKSSSMIMQLNLTKFV